MASFRGIKEKKGKEMKKKVGYDLGHKEVSPSKDYKNKVCYPTIYLSDKELPYLEEIEVGDKVSFLCLFKLVSKEERENEKEEICNYTLELQKVAEDAEMKMTKALEEFMGPHKEVEEESDKDEKTEGKEG